MRIDATTIDAAKTPAGGWTKKQLAAWGVPWPPPKGWREALESGRPLAGILSEPLPAAQLVGDVEFEMWAVMTGEDPTKDPGTVRAWKDEKVAWTYGQTMGITPQKVTLIIKAQR